MEVVMNRTTEHWLFTWTVTDAKGTAKTYFVSEHHINVQCRPDEKDFTRDLFNALYAGVPVRVHAAYSKPILTIKPGETDADSPVATAPIEQKTNDYFARQEANIKSLTAQAAIFKSYGVV